MRLASTSSCLTPTPSQLRTPPTSVYTPAAGGGPGVVWGMHVAAAGAVPVLGGVLFQGGDHDDEGGEDCGVACPGGSDHAAVVRVAGSTL